MPKFEITFACMVPVYARASIEAATFDEARQLARKMALHEVSCPDSDAFEFNTENVDRRDIYVVHIDAPTVT